jgi:DNA mismatch endonuclease (patch repair protein)
MPVRDTNPELLLRRELHRRGLRFTLHDPALPGRPDICLTRAKVVVFVDGCFWHGCPEHGTVPKNNREWWSEKLDRTRQRDRAKDDAVSKLGYVVVHVWEHENPVFAADRIEGIWRERTGRPRGTRPHD